MQIDYEQEPEKSNRQRHRNIKWIYLSVIAVLLCTNLVLLFQRNKARKEAQHQEARTEESLHKQKTLQQDFNSSLIRLDHLMSENAQLNGQLELQDKEVRDLQEQIRAILSKENQSEAELAKAQELIHELNQKLMTFENQLAELKAENQKLRGEKQQMIGHNRVLQEQVELGKVVSISNIRLLPINLRRGGRKEVETAKARRIDLLRILFDVNKNRLLEEGVNTFYVQIFDPTGQLLSNAALGSGRFQMHDGEYNDYTLSKELPLKAGEAVQDVAVDWQQSADYLRGIYTVEIYHRGFHIASGSVRLR